MTESRMYERAMRRAMELSLLGPTYGGNPQVGAVILDKDLNIIAEGVEDMEEYGLPAPYSEELETMIATAVDRLYLSIRTD